MEKQLGLKLTAATLPMEVLVIDGATRPTPNAAEAEAFVKATSPAVEFEVADIKHSAPVGPVRGPMIFGVNVEPGGRVTVSNQTLRNLIMDAWNLTPEMMVGGPKWIDGDRWDIIAKAPAVSEGESISEGPFGSPGIYFDEDVVDIMLQALLKERFKLVVHEEEQPVQAYTLLVGKPKMKRADPTARTKFMEGPAARDAKDPRNDVNSRMITAQNVTMAQFAARLQSLASGYIRVPVLDQTRLDGAYNFTLTFAPAGRVGMGRGGRGGTGDAAPPRDGPAVAADPNGAISLPEAVEKQLGLKLERQKRPVKVLVIEKIERTPTEN